MLNPDVAQYMSDGQRIDTHDGEIFCDLDDAREYAREAVDTKICTRFVIGCFALESQAERMYISSIETFGFRHDKTNSSQLELFK